MTSEERHEARFRRRTAAREAKRRERNAEHDSFDRVFSYGNLYKAYQQCRKGVAWKASVQKYISNAPLNVRKTEKLLQSGKFKSSGFMEFDLVERGKKRHIKSVHISERVVQRCLCDNALVPVLQRTFIHDNGACMKNKGYTFAISRIEKHLRQHYRKHGTEGYILLFDFSKFFDNVNHAVIKGILRREFTDERILKLTEHFIDVFGEKGLGLGSQISQILALASANRLDHYIKEQCRIKGYGRYNDDGYLIHRSKAYLKRCLRAIGMICRMLGITLNTKKTQIVKLSHGFTFLKVRFFLLPSGRIVKKLSRTNIVRMRRKLKAYVRLLEDKKMTFEDLYTSWQSWKAYAARFDAWHAIRNARQIYFRQFIFPRRIQPPV